jgi:hypothetical protein
MPMVFAVLVVDNRQVKLKLCGLTADRLFIPKTINANGKNFIAVSANRFGGLGVTIVHHQNLAIGQFGTIMMTI